MHLKSCEWYNRSIEWFVLTAPFLTVLIKQGSNMRLVPRTEFLLGLPDGQME